METLVFQRIERFPYLLIRKITKCRGFCKRSAADLAHKSHGTCSNKNTPILVLHGLLGSKRNWDGLSKSLASRLDTCTVVIDARNHGQSSHESSHTYPELAEDVSNLMNKLEIKRANIIGHSMGGRTAMVLALTQPDRIERLVIVDISPISSPGILKNFFPKLIDVMKSVNFQGATNLNQARNIAKEQILKSGVLTKMEGMNFLLMNIGSQPDNTFNWVCNLDVLIQSFEIISSFPEDMKNNKFYGSTLFIGGQKSEYLPPSDFDGIKTMFPKSELKYIPNTGHNVHAEDPNTFLKLVTEFLSTK